MSSDNDGSAAGSGATSTPPPPKVSEQDYLDRQMQEARDAISRTLQEMADSVNNMADPRAWIEQHPWASLTTGAAVGFFLASSVTPTNEETLAERLKSLIPERSRKESQPIFIRAEEPKRSRLLNPLIKAVTSAVAASVAAAVRAHTADVGHGDNGHESEEPASPS
jgi:hypothetical protein